MFKSFDNFEIDKIKVLYTGCSAKMYPIFVLFISPVKIETFQVCLFHIIGSFVFHPNFFFLEYLLNYECTVRS